LRFTAFVQDYSSLLIVDSFFAAIVLIFFILNFKTTIPLFRFKKHSVFTVIIIVIIAPIIAMAVFYIAKFLNKNIFDFSENIYYNQFKDSPAPLLFSIISIGVFPAIFEEMAFRGILFNQSLKIMRLKPTIIITSILFTILHLSLISVFWIFPIGLILGYLRAKNKSILYSMIAHFSYNTSILLLQIVLT
jgi:membrane protease YdiL (CAAX protease family)